MITAKELLEAALSELQKRGMAKNIMFRQDGAVCMMGAINAGLGQIHRRDLTCEENDAKTAAFDALAVAISEETNLTCICGTPSCPGLLITFNDADVTTQEDVELIFKKAIYEAGN